MNDDRGSDAGEVAHDNQTSEEALDQRTFREWAERLGLTDDELRLFVRQGFKYDAIPPKNTAARRALIAQLGKTGCELPKWALISGLYPNFTFSEPERRKRLSALYKVTALLIKRALAQDAAEPDSQRSIFWEPVAEICRDLCIAQSMLSSLIKEYSGHSLSQLIDCVRAERLKKLMRRQIRQFVREFRAQCATSGTKTDGEISVADVWNALKASRKWPAFCRNSWAIGFGFSSYRKMYRACLAIYKQTPHQMELALIAECLGETEDGGESAGEGDEGEFKLEAIRQSLREIRAYDDES